MAKARTLLPGTTRALLAWIRERAIFVAPGSIAPQQFAALDDVCGDARIAVLTTTTPDVAQTHQFLGCMLDYLRSRGFDLIGAPVSWAEGSASPRRFGFAVNAHPGGMDELVALVDAAETQDEMLANLRRLLTQRAATDIDDEIERIAWLMEWVDLQFATLTDRLGGKDYQRLIHGLAVQHDSLNYHKLATDPATPRDAEAEKAAEAEIAAAAEKAVETLRQQIAQSCIAFALSELYPQRRAVLLIDSTEKPPLLQFVRHTLAPMGVFSVWMLHGGGRTGITKPRLRASGAPSPANGPARLSIKAGSLNALLAKVGGTFVLPLGDLGDPRAAPLRQAIDVMQRDNSVIRCNLAREMDAIYFAHEISPVTPTL